MTIKSLVQNGLYSLIRVNNGNGYGSTATATRRFVSTITNIGKSITYADSASAGATFTIGVSGVYAITYCERYPNVGELGITRNASSGSTQISSLTAAEVLSITHQTAAASRRICVSWCGYLDSGDIIRATGDGTAAINADVFVSFSIAQVD
jgi:hypothetical protein